MKHMIAAALLALTVSPGVAASLKVVDGDTVRVDDELVRLVGFDAPELRARCRTERILAEAAANYLRGLLLEGPAVLHFERGRDRWGRRLARLTVAGRDVGRELIRVRLVRPYAGGKRRGWCG